MATREFRLPDVGEGLTEAEIVNWRVKPGDRLAINDPVVEIETAKSLVELPSPFEGVVERLLVEPGELVPVGTPIITVAMADEDGEPSTGDGEPSEEGPAQETASAPASAAEPPADAPRPAPVSTSVEERGHAGAMPTLVGYGPVASTGQLRRRRSRGGVLVTLPAPGEARAEPAAAPSRPAPREPGAHRPLATPPVRRLAKDLGVDLATVTPTGSGGTVTRDDVTAAAAQPEAQPEAQPRPQLAVEDGAARESRVPVRGVRRATAKAMVSSAFTAPQVTEWVAVDVTRTMKLLDRLRHDREFADVGVSPLLAVARALLIAVRRHPDVNARWDEDAGEIVVRHYVNLGIAAATSRGLLVPVVRDADRMTLPQLAAAIGEVVASARAGRTAPSDTTGGTITITNIGVFGVDGGTPLLVPDQAAILAVGQVRQMPWVHRGRVRPRSVVQLGLTFDHRMVDGELGSRVLADVAAVLEHPDLALARA